MFRFHRDAGGWYLTGASQHLGDNKQERCFFPMREKNIQPGYGRCR
jgi:hypothetical protein